MLRIDDLPLKNRLTPQSRLLVGVSKATSRNRHIFFSPYSRLYYQRHIPHCITNGRISCCSTDSMHLCTLCRQRTYPSLLNIIEELRCYSKRCESSHLQSVFLSGLSFKIDASGRLFRCLASQCFIRAEIAFCCFLPDMFRGREMLDPESSVPSQQAQSLLLCVYSSRSLHHMNTAPYESYRGLYQEGREQPGADMREWQAAICK